MNKILQTALLLCLVGAFSQTLMAQAGGTKPELNMYRYNSTQGLGNPQPVVLGDTVGTLQFKSLTGVGAVRTGASIRSFITGPVSSGFVQQNLVFRTGAPIQRDRMVITAEGLVGIGTMDPLYHLHVVGNTHTSGDFFGRIHMDANPGIGAAPNTYLQEAYFESKLSSSMEPTTGLTNLSSGGGLLTLAPSNNGAGPQNTDHQLFFNNGGIFHRQEAANNGAWTAAWAKLLTSADINGTPNRIARFLPPDNPSSKLGDSQLFDDGARVGIRNFTPATDIDFTGATRIAGNLGLGILPTANRLEVLGNSRLDGTATVTGVATVNSLAVTTTATVSGAATVNSLTVNTNATVTSNTTTNSLNVTTNGRVDGRLVVGNPPSTPGTHSLYVNGSIVCEEAKVALQAAWPDYVFETGYTAPDPCEWEEFILKNKHLPGMPSAKQVEANGGIELGETQRLLLEKIEQLTLMVIEQQKQIDALKK